jgi:hemerythrin-like metal-binding protein
MLNWKPEVHAVGVAAMDATHEDFVRQLGELAHAGAERFPALFHALCLHTRAHFENESLMMRACAFPAIAEHESEHRRVLGELALVGRGIAAGRLGLARAYVAVGMPDWFHKHLATMDSALAARLKRAAAAGPGSGMPPAPRGPAS